MHNFLAVRFSVSVNASGNFHFAELSEGARSVLKDAHRAYVDTCNDLQSQSGQRQRQSHGNLSSSYSEEQQVQKSHRILRQKFDSTKHSLPQKFDGSSVNSTHQQGIQKRVREASAEWQYLTYLSFFIGKFNIWVTKLLAITNPSETESRISI